MRARGSWSMQGSKMIAVEPSLAPGFERAFGNGAPHIAHQRKQEMYIVQGEKMHAERLFRYEQVADVRTSESRAGRAVAPAVQRERIRSKLYVAYVESPLAREGGAGAPHPRRRDAVEEVDSAPRALDEVFGKAHAHEIARPVRRKRVAHDVEHLVHRRLRLANRQSTDGDAAPVAHRSNRARGRAPKLGMRASLHDREKRLRRAGAGLDFLQSTMLALTALEPSQRAVARVERLRVRRLAGDHVVELHDHVGTEGELQRHYALRREEPARAIDVRLKGDAIFAHGAHPLEREHLEAAGVREHRAVPRHEALHAAHRAHDILARTQMQMVRV